jgi:tetratricopeptide (TPR) repeat protein
MEAAWTKAINLAHDNAAAWSNRGTARLQNGQWQAAYDDLSAAARLEEQQLGAANGLTLNNLGNAEGALGRWQDAMQHYEAAADDADVGSIALANYALAAFETGQDDLAIKSARSLLRRWVHHTHAALVACQALNRAACPPDTHCCSGTC